MPELKKGDYVVALTDINSIVKRSVGIVKEISNNEVTVFFIGKGTEIEANKSDVSYIDVKKIGEKKEIKKKICNVCHQLKEISEFEINQTDAKGNKTTRPTCRECRKEINGVPILSKDAKILRKSKPNDIFTCPICHKTTIVGVTANLVMDHDHKTGKSREWICDSCNTGLGRFRDSIEVLQRAIDYLKKYS